MGIDESDVLPKTHSVYLHLLLTNSWSFLPFFLSSLLLLQVISFQLLPPPPLFHLHYPSYILVMIGVGRGPSHSCAQNCTVSCQVLADLLQSLHCWLIEMFLIHLKLEILPIVCNLLPISWSSWLWLLFAAFLFSMLPSSSLFLDDLSISIPPVLQFHFFHLF